MRFLRIVPGVGLAIVAALSMAACSAGKSIVTLDVQATVPGGGLPRASTAVAGASRAVASPVVIPVMAKDGTTKLGELSLQVATLAIKNIEIEMEPAQVDSQEERDQELEIEFPGTYLVDLLSNSVTPALPDVSLLTGGYDEIELSIDKLDGTELKADGTPLVASGDPMFGRSIYVKGSYTGTIKGASYVGLPFTLAYDLDEGIELSGADPAVGMVVDSGSLNPIIIAFRLKQWFDFSNTKTNSGLACDLNDIVIGTENGAPAILLVEGATGANALIREVIEENIEESADFGIDADGDGILQPDEDDDATDVNDI
ncbi:MAG: hypothetical protein KKA67_09935 [Spirochaetes bacterium]|nr:hypothetical protein [Spirochaetota bacterium]MBU1081241.1 hypothetical protein [Spirochaetota bacterium]